MIYYSLRKKYAHHVNILNIQGVIPNEEVFGRNSGLQLFLGPRYLFHAATPTNRDIFPTMAHTRNSRLEAIRLALIVWALHSTHC